MMLVHVVPAQASGPGWVSARWIATGHSSALFALLAGVGIALATGGAEPRRRAPVSMSARALLVRSAILVAIGVLLASLPGGYLYVILAYYGVLFLAAVPVLRLGARPLFVLAAAAVLVGPALQHVLAPHLPTFAAEHLTIGTIAGDPWKALTMVLVTGVYPVVTWVAYLYAGMALGRLDLARRSVGPRMVLGGAIVSAAAWTGSIALLTLGGVVDRLPDLNGVRVSTSDLALGEFLGSTPPDSWWWLVTVTPHSSTPFELAHGVGFAMVALGASLWLTTTVGERGRRWVASMIAAGSMTLTLYCLHVLVVDEGVFRRLEPWQQLAIQVAAALALATWWCRRHARGPLEQMVHSASRAGARAASTDGRDDAARGPRPRVL